MAARWPDERAGAYNSLTGRLLSASDWQRILHHSCDLADAARRVDFFGWGATTLNAEGLAPGGAEVARQASRAPS